VDGAGNLSRVIIPSGKASFAPISGSSPRSTASTARRPAHLPQLDGLRTVAVLLVLVYHVARTEELAFLPGGFVGVDVFFVLSGFLITTLLLREHGKTGSIDLRRFYVRRLWRLYPALLLVSAVVAGVLAFAPATFGLEAASPAEALVALSYGMSWWSGLELTGGPYLLGLTWSLSVEEHFYLLWPVLLIALLRRGGGLRAVVGVAALANAWPALLFLTGAAPDRLYYLPDSRFAQLLTGCALAALLLRRDEAGGLGRLERAFGPAAAATALTALAVVALTGHRTDAWYWVGGMQVLGLGAALVIGHLVLHADSRLSAALRWGPLPVLGLWSYGIYLWHLPLIRLAQPVLGDTLAVATGAALLAIPVAAASYRFVEQPVLRWSRRPHLTAAPAAREPQRTRELTRSAA
jgi:peptidoglycan/LPS O-acetylase OafA/YrhL